MTTWKLFVLFYATVVKSMERSSVFMKRAKMADQAMSGTGFSYAVHSGTPLGVSSEDNENDDALIILRELGYDPFTTGRYAEQYLTSPYNHLYEKQSTYDENPIAIGVNEASYNLPGTKIVSLSPLEYYEKLSYPYAEGYRDGGANYLKEGGKNFDASDKSRQKEDVKTDYQNQKDYVRGLRHKYSNEDNKSIYNQNGGQKTAKYDGASNYGVKNEKNIGSLGTSFSNDDGHKKGEKTSGYHKLYHKDAYDKQDKFYDESNKQGHFNKYGDYNVKHGSLKGIFGNGNRQDMLFDSRKFSSKGLQDKELFDKLAKEFKSIAGEKINYKNVADYENKREKQVRKEKSYDNKA